ncbi:MAG: hypothetical protein IPJ69_05930 [Deltaproteobacteria bacterium]|nr:MAG: hypothetical protein IPJ69_05930 [Deltaproteobacteria bacterium]
MTEILPFFKDPFIIRSLIIGLGFGVINFLLLSRVIGGFIVVQNVDDAKARQKIVIKTILMLILKMTLIFGTIGLLLWNHHVSPLAFLGGFTVSLLIAIPAKLLQKGTDHA